MHDLSEARKRLIIALDLPTVEEARAAAAKLAGQVGVFKIGLELLFSGGLSLAEELIAGSHDVFIDAKLLDIPNTVERATAQLCRLQPQFITVHAACPLTLAAAVKGRGTSHTKLLAVTVLTSMDEQSLRLQTFGTSALELVHLRAKWAFEAGFNGAVASPWEAARLKQSFGAAFLIVTPGIRPASDAPPARDDQARKATPLQAVRNGADYLVIGRPILQASDPAEAARKIAQEIAAVLP